MLGLVSFGGPAAHIGYFQKAFVEKHQWITPAEFAKMVALSQFLPGPGSSQVGFSIGYHRANLGGGVSAFIGFTFPSFVLMFLLVVIGREFTDTRAFSGVVDGLKLLAVVVVADAIFTMFRSFCQRYFTRIIAVATAIILIFVSSIGLQLLCLIVSAFVACWYLQRKETPANAVNDNFNDKYSNTSYSTINWWALSAFLFLLIVLPLFEQSFEVLSMFSSFYQAGSFVFGGGHVVLPLLQESVGNALTPEEFLTGYAAAQAIPGPMFTIATYLGAMLTPNMPLLGGVVATFAIFLPGFLLIIAMQKSWQQFSLNSQVSNAMTGINASVVGLLLAAFYQPIVISAIHTWLDVLIVVVGFYLLKSMRLPIVALVITFAAVGVIRII